MDNKVLPSLPPAPLLSASVSDLTYPGSLPTAQRTQTPSPPPTPLRRLRPSSPALATVLNSGMLGISRNFGNPSSAASRTSPFRATLSPTRDSEQADEASRRTLRTATSRQRLFCDADVSFEQTRAEVRSFYLSVSEHLAQLCGLPLSSDSDSTTEPYMTRPPSAPPAITSEMIVESPRASHEMVNLPLPVGGAPSLVSSLSLPVRRPMFSQLLSMSQGPSQADVDALVAQLRNLMINALQQFQEDESLMLETLDQLRATKSEDRLNDFRRLFRDQVARVGASFTQWEKDFGIKIGLKRIWETPEYISSKEYAREVQVLRDMRLQGSSGYSSSPALGSPMANSVQADSSQPSSSGFSVAAAMAAASAAAEAARWDGLEDYRTKIKVFSHELNTVSTSAGAPSSTPSITVQNPAGIAAGSRKQHIRFKFAEGRSIFSCTVYFAEQFEQLRRRCNMSSSFIQSLSRCAQWHASGGKSKAVFFKTHDDRLVVKQLASNWTLVEKDALLKFAPAYFDYMNKADKSPTLLAKIFGFYNVKYRNTTTGATSDIDILVMENLFCNAKISRKFDLKGVEGRHSKKSNLPSSPAATSRPPSSAFSSAFRATQYFTGPTNPADDDESGSRTPTTAFPTPAAAPAAEEEVAVMWDGDWVDGRFRNQLMLHGHSKRIITEAIQNDTDFLAGANVMDYSLLVGVNDLKREMIVGIVDFIGPYTWYKRLETRSKTTLKGGREDAVTVIPPEQYADRFRRALDQYFLMVPDKWINLEDSESRPESIELPT
ncbi:hypothetical protein HK405_009026, partial [Cladochytrium tenue]